LSENNLYEEARQFTINSETNLVYNSGETFYGDKIAKGVLLPIKFQLKKYFEFNNNNNLNTSLKHYEYLMNTSGDNLIKHYVHGKQWKEKVSLFNNKIVIPYFMYIDDFEINNPLGSHASVQSLAAIYYSFPLLDQSKLNNIHLAALIKTVNMKEFGNNLSLQKLIDELNDIEVNGISICTPEGNKQVHFILGLFIGDNLALNSISEFSKSFSANYFCRFCTAHKSLTHKLCEENDSLLRNNVNYSEDVNKNNFKETSIYSESILNNITSFHVVKNFSLDIMHDLFEGICHYNMCHIIHYYTELVKIFSLEELNFRKQNFNYGCIEIGNISPPIKTIHLKKFHLKMSAREMMTFVHYFSLIVGDLIPEDDAVWLFYLNFLEIVDTLLSNQFTQNSILLLKLI